MKTIIRPLRKSPCRLGIGTVATLVMSTAAQALVGNSDPIFSSTLISRAFVSHLPATAGF